MMELSYLPKMSKMSVTRAWKAGKNSSCCLTLMMMLEDESGK